MYKNGVEHKPKWLFIGGVNISGTIDETKQQSPLPDYIALRKALQPDVIDIHSINVVRHPLIIAINRLLGPYWALAIYTYIRADRYDAIFATGEDVGLVLALVAKIFRRKLPLVITCHNVATRRKKLYLRWLKLGSVVEKFLCLSQAQARILIERYYIPEANIRVINWFVDHQFFNPNVVSQQHNQICSAGMASRDYATLIKAVSNLRVELKIAADSPWFQERLNILQGDLPPHVDVRSYGNYQALRQLYADSLFVVVPLHNVDYSAGYSVILEAMAMGKAVIASRIKQVDDFIIDGWNGFHVTPGDAEQLRERIHYLLQHPDRAKQLGRNGRLLVEKRFTYEQYIQYVHNALESVKAK